MALDREALRMAEKHYRLLDGLRESVARVEEAPVLGCCRAEGDASYGYVATEIVACPTSEAKEQVRSIMLSSLKSEVSAVCRKLVELGFDPDAPQIPRPSKSPLHSDYQGASITQDA